MVGDVRYVNGCRLLPPDVVQQRFAAGDGSRFQSEFVDATVPVETAEKRALTVGGAAASYCNYRLNGPEGSTVTVDVQYRTAKDALKRWKDYELWGTGQLSREHERRQPHDATWQAEMDTIRELEADGGIHLPGMQPDALVLKKSGRAVVRVGALLITVTYDRGSAHFDPTNPQAREQWVRTMKPVLKEVLANAVDKDLPQTTPTGWGERLEPAIIDPCSVLDEAVQMAASRHASERVESSSLPLNPTTPRPEATTPYARSLKTDCGRISTASSAGGKNTLWSTDLTLHYQPSGTTAHAFLENLVQRLLLRNKPTTYTLDQLMNSNVANRLSIPGADVAVIFANSTGPQGNAYGIFTHGPYIVKIRATTRLEDATAECCDVPREQLEAAMRGAAENLARLADAAGVED